MESVVTIVDDNEELRFLVAYLLQHEYGIRSLKFTSLEDVIVHESEVLESQVVLLDINLGAGEPDGVAVFEWLKAHGYQGRVLFLTGHAKGSPFVNRAAETGAPILEKPMSAEELVLLLRDSVIHSKMRDTA